MHEEEEISLAGLSGEERDQYVAERALQIIMSSGDARTLAKQAMDKGTEGKFDEADDLLKQAEKKQVAAHNVQTAMIQGDIRGGDEKLGYYVLFAHAQDTMMTIQTEINLTKSLLKIMKANEERFAAIEAKL
jgi:cellobiose PTS system EIIA component